MDISLAPGGAAEPQGQVGQLPGVGQGQTAGKPGQATTAIGWDVNKPVKSYLHSEKVKI